MHNNHQPSAFSFQPVLWGLLHGLNDFAAGFMLAYYTYHHPAADSFLYIVIYSVIGFGGQLPVGLWLDYKKQLKPFAAAALIVLPLSILLFFIHNETGIIFSGIASAFVHVTGGTVCLQMNNNKTGPLALFTAPGVLGLTIGGALGIFSIHSLWFVLAAIIIIAYITWQQDMPFYTIPEKKQSQLDTHDFIMLGILLLMCFRSFVFDIINQVAYNFENGIVIFGISAFAGKIIGGFVADKIGWKKFVYISLPLAILLFQLGKNNIYALAFGIACLQSSVPITLLLMYRSLPLYPATATAFSLGTSIVLAGLPLFLIGHRQVINAFNNEWLTAVFFAAIFSGWWCLKKILLLKKINRSV